MQHIQKLLCILLSALLLMGALSGCAEEETEEQVRYQLRAAVCGMIDSFDPALNTDAHADALFYSLYENLLRSAPDEEGAVLPGVAKEYETVQNYDGTVDYLFTLRSTARWSDGTRVKAKDFVFAWKRLVDPALDSPNSELLSMVSGYDAARATGDLSQFGVKAEGDSVFRVTLDKPCPYFLSDVCTAVATMPLRSDRVNSDVNWADGSDVPCNGPFQISFWAKASYVQLRRNTSYYDSRAVAPDTLRLYFISDVSEAEALYRQGGVDIALTRPDNPDAAVYPPLRTVNCVFYNHISDIFSNAHVRRAFDLTLDRGAIAAAAGAGMSPATGYVPSGVVGNGALFRDETEDLCAVDEEGYVSRCLEAENELRIGGFWGGVGFPEVACIYPADSGLRTAAESVSSMWNEKLRVNIRAEGLEREEYDRRIREGEYDLAVGSVSAPYNDAVCYLEQFAGSDGDNALHYVNKPFDLLIGVAQGSTDPAARTAILHDAESLLLEDTALSPLYFVSCAYLLRETLVPCDLQGTLYLAAATQAEQE